jgi:hypothetical protein
MGVYYSVLNGVIPDRLAELTLSLGSLEILMVL